MLSRLLPLIVFVLAAIGCGEDAAGPCEEGAEEKGGPRCCAGGCGMGTDGWSPRICKKGEWVCQGSNPALEDACASPQNACTPLEGCHVVGLGNEEPDPAPELCCEGSCSNEKAVHRVCKSGTTWECPAGAVPISRCKDYETACGGILARYRDNGFKLP
jgi:hypothetical protein